MNMGVNPAGVFWLRRVGNEREYRECRQSRRDDLVKLPARQEARVWSGHARVLVLRPVGKGVKPLGPEFMKSRLAYDTENGLRKTGN
jgi:hypothetical protein